MTKLFHQGDIVLVPFPFTNLSNVKIRPALVLSNENLQGQDLIICAISSQKGVADDITLTNMDLVEGNLPLTSFVKPSKIITLKKTLIKQRVAKISTPKKKEVAKILAYYFYSK